MAERLIEIQDTNQFQALCGSFDENLKLLEQRYHVRMTCRGDTLRIQGDGAAAELAAEREGIALRYAKAWNAVVVLKGARTVVASPDGRVCVNPTGNPGLARGGSGDVLAGMLAALLACGLPAYEAAACAVYLHGAAADRAAAKRGEYGMLPHDILPELGTLFAENQR